MLWLVKKSLLTGYRAVIENLNRLRNIASYYTIKELEPGLTFQETESDNCTPTAMSLNSEKAIGVILNNLVWFVEVLTG